MIMAANKIEQIIFSTFKLMFQTAFFYIVDYIVSPPGGDKWLFIFFFFFVIESFIQEIQSKLLIHSVMEQVKYLWVNHSFN